MIDFLPKIIILKMDLAILDNDNLGSSFLLQSLDSLPSFPNYACHQVARHLGK